MENEKLQLFEDQKIRTAWDEEKEGNELVTNCHQLKLNAIEHTDAGGYVSISITKSNSLIIIRVEDSGNGIGLSMAKDIVEAHHGSIQAGNNIDKGAWFEIRLLCLDGADIYKRT